MELIGEIEFVKIMKNINIIKEFIQKEINETESKKIKNSLEEYLEDIYNDYDEIRQDYLFDDDVIKTYLLGLSKIHYSMYLEEDIIYDDDDEEIIKEDALLFYEYLQKKLKEMKSDN